MAQVITDLFLDEMAKALNKETYDTPNYLVLGSSEATSLSNSQPTVEGEYPTRIELSGSRTDNELIYSALRQGVAVTGAEDALVTSGLTVSGVTDDTDLMAAIIHNGVTQTSNFDIEWQWTLKVDR